MNNNQQFGFINGIYVGEAENGIPNGKGKIAWENDNYYEGDFLDGSFHGYGIFHMTDFIHAEGIWSKHNFIDGRAVYGDTMKCSGCEPGAVYEGRFEQFLCVGKGKIIRTNGEIYEGEILNGKAHGKGKLTLSDGTVIEGAWTNGEKEQKYTDDDYEISGGDKRFFDYC